ncbi:hypothetical protein [Undibacterium sp. Tian12W]|uniref:hypothetical protein n=1 Tax=Undibacterium sp. Tian12W TaxID=3413054 RepID=UPI003BF22B0D
MNEIEPVPASPLKKLLWMFYFNALWLFLLLPACFVAAYLSYDLGIKNMQNMPYLVGQLFAQAAVGAVIFYYLLLRKRGKTYLLFIFLLFFAVMYVAGDIGMDKQRQQAKIAIQSAREEMQKLTTAVQQDNNSKDGNQLSSVIKAGSATTPRASGQYGEIERLLKDIMMGAATFRNDYVRDLKATGWENITDIKRIRQDKDMLESKRILNAARAVVNKFEGNTENLFETYRAKINALSLDEEAKRGLLKGFNRSAQNSKNQFAQNWALEKKTMQEVEGMLTLLTDKKKWNLQGEQIIFYDRVVMAQFDQHQQRLQSISKEQDDMQERHMKKSSDALDKLDNIFQK